MWCIQEINYLHKPSKSKYSSTELQDNAALIEYAPSFLTAFPVHKKKESHDLLLCHSISFNGQPKSNFLKHLFSFNPWANSFTPSSPMPVPAEPTSKNIKMWKKETIKHLLINSSLLLRSRLASPWLSVNDLPMAAAPAHESLFPENNNNCDSMAFFSLC